MAKIELDYYEYPTSELAQAAYVSSDLGILSNADIDDEDMADISDWTDADVGDGASTQVTFDGKSCMKMDGGTSDGYNNYARSIQDIGSFGARTVFSLNLYCDLIGTNASDSVSYFRANDGSTQFYVRFCSDGLFVYDGSTSVEVGTDLIVQDTWQEWTFDVDWTAKTVDVYLDGILKASDVDCSYAGIEADGLCTFATLSPTIAHTISYIDWFKAGSDTTSNPNFPLLQCYSESTIKQQGTYSLKVVAVQTDSLNDTLTKSGLSIDLSDKEEIKVDVYASRTGTNIQLQLINEPASWDLLNEDCSDISDWVDGDEDTGVSEVDPAGQFRFDTNLGAVGNGIAYRHRDIGSYPNTFTVEVKLYHDAIGTFANSDYFNIQCFQGDEFLELQFRSDGLFIQDTESGTVEVGTDLVKQGGSAEWQTWRFLVTYTGTTGEGTCDVYLKDSTHDWEKVGTAVACSYEGTYTDGKTNIYQFGITTDNMVTLVDYFKIVEGLYVPIHTKDIVISQANIWETKTWDISEIINADKDNIEQIIIKIVNADTDNTFYMDNMYAQDVALDNAVLFGINF